MSEKAKPSKSIDVAQAKIDGVPNIEIINALRARFSWDQLDTVTFDGACENCGFGYVESATAHESNGGPCKGEYLSVS
jgi:hypothetical protein